MTKRDELVSDEDIDIVAGIFRRNFSGEPLAPAWYRAFARRIEGLLRKRLADRIREDAKRASRAARIVEGEHD